MKQKKRAVYITTGMFLCGLTTVVSSVSCLFLIRGLQYSAELGGGEWAVREIF